MNESVWTSYGNAIWSLSWSPSGSRLASGFHDGTILIQNGKSGKVEVGPIQAEEGSVWSLAYSSSGKKIASGGDSTISIWNTKTGERVIGPIKGLGHDSCCSFLGVVVRTQLFPVVRRPFTHKQCIGVCGPRNVNLRYVSFSRDGRHLAYGGSDNKLTLWMVKDIFPRPQVRAPTLLEQSDGQSTQQETRSNSPSSSCPEADSTRRGSFIEEVYDDPYNNFFHSSQQSLPSPSPGFHFPSLSPARHFWNVISRRRPPPDKSVPQDRSKHGFFSRRARSNTSLELPTIEPNQPVSERKVHPVDIAACRDEDRYGIAPESDAEAAAAMLRTNDDVADISTRPGQLAVGVQVSQGRPTQAQASTSGPEEIAYE
ncbi:WD40-repeat-containing domain protein [Suillus spraguei]|nr:WD40-repeat-containing domain protein [Suillus spraguei]